VDQAEIVKLFLRGQNLEQVGRTDEAIELYEVAVTARFDSTGPYDRLIFLYSQRAVHNDVVRVADLALANVQTHGEKKAWYETMRSQALKAAAQLPEAAPKRRPDESRR
jgi:hypothetical protein